MFRLSDLNGIQTDLNDVLRTRCACGSLYDTLKLCGYEQILRHLGGFSLVELKIQLLFSSESHQIHKLSHTVLLCGL